MKNYDELTNELLKRRDCYVAEKRRKRKAALCIAAPVCCACAVLLLGLGLWKKNVNPDKLVGNGNTAMNTESYGNENKNASTGTTEKRIDNYPAENDDPIEITFVVNRTNNKLGGALLDYTIISDYREVKNLEEINEYLGYDVTKLTAVMPDGFRFAGNYEVEFYYKNDGTLVYDHCYLGYANGEQWITIGVSKIGTPYDCIYLMDNPTPTVINGVEIVIGAYYTDENSNDYDVVFADFTCNGMYYRVTLSNMPTTGENDGITCMIDILSELTK